MTVYIISSNLKHLNTMQWQHTKVLIILHLKSLWPGIFDFLVVFLLFFFFTSFWLCITFFYTLAFEFIDNAMFFTVLKNYKWGTWYISVLALYYILSRRDVSVLFGITTQTPLHAHYLMNVVSQLIPFCICSNSPFSK